MGSQWSAATDATDRQERNVRLLGLSIGCARVVRDRIQGEKESRGVESGVARGTRERSPGGGTVGRRRVYRRAPRGQLQLRGLGRGSPSQGGARGHFPPLGTGTVGQRLSRAGRVPSRASVALPRAPWRGALLCKKFGERTLRSTPCGRRTRGEPGPCSKPFPPGGPLPPPPAPPDACDSQLTARGVFSVPLGARSTCERARRPPRRRLARRRRTPWHLKSAGCG